MSSSAATNKKRARPKSGAKKTKVKGEDVGDDANKAGGAAASQQPVVPTYDVYRGTALFDTWSETLQEMVDDEELSPELAGKVLDTFDASMNEQISATKSTGKLAGNLHTYRYSDGIWQMTLENAKLQLGNTVGGGDVCMGDINNPLENVKLRIVAQEKVPLDKRK
jgi:hypothetical protein